MAQAFLEERLPACIRIGASWGDDYRVEITTTAGGAEYRRLVHPYPQRRFRVTYVREVGEMHDAILALYNRAHGRFAGFRVRAIDDYSTNGRTGTPTAYDQPLGVITAGSSYQLQKLYGTGAAALAEVGYPVRTIFKPVAGTALVGVTNPLTGNFAANDYAVNYTTGIVTITDLTRPVTGITQAASAVITVGAGHPYQTGDSVHISGVTGMTEINGRRGRVTGTGATTITVNIDSTAFTAYAGSGVVHSAPQTGETATGGCEFDLPCRFDSAIDVTPLSPQYQETAEIDIIELIAL